MPERPTGTVTFLFTDVEGSTSLLDEVGPATYASELARAYVYADRFDDAVALLTSVGARALYVQTAIARYKMWHGETYKITADVPADLPPGMSEYMRIAKQLHETRQITPAQREGALSGMEQTHPRLRTARSQFVCEYLLFCGEPDLALDAIKVGVDAGLLDHQWMQHCPLLAPLRSRPEFQPLAAIVATRSQAVLDAVLAAET